MTPSPPEHEEPNMASEQRVRRPWVAPTLRIVSIDQETGSSDGPTHDGIVASTPAS